MHKLQLLPHGSHVSPASMLLWENTAPIDSVIHSPYCCCQLFTCRQHLLLPEMLASIIYDQCKITVVNGHNEAAPPGKQSETENRTNLNIERTRLLNSIWPSYLMM